MSLFASTRAALLVPLFLLVSCVQPEDALVSSDPNGNPVIQALVADPPEVSIGQSITVTVTATHPGGKPLTYRWGATTGDIIGSGPSVRYSASFCCAGQNYVTVTVLDNAGGSATQDVGVFIYFP
ncbi:MAG: hypothetical protein OEV30_07170 [Ignavibacteria bacterium]|nr:hypothetical protein [Ignavibacteria bacterium]